MDDEPMWAADHVVAPTPGSAITIPETTNEFSIKGNHLTLVKGNQFDGTGLGWGRVGKTMRSHGVRWRVARSVGRSGCRSTWNTMKHNIVVTSPNALELGYELISWNNLLSYVEYSLADYELTVGKSHARNGEWVDITIRKVNTLLSMDKDADWQNYLKYINTDLREDHKTSYQEMYIASLKISENYKAQPYQYASSSKQILKANAKPFLPCTHCGFNDHRPDDCRNYPKCEICGSYDHSTSRHNRVIHIKRGVLAESSQSNDPQLGNMTGVKSYLHKYVEKPSPKVVFDDNSSCITEGYGSINYGEHVKKGSTIELHSKLNKTSPSGCVCIFFIWTCLDPKKSQAPEMIMSFVMMVENQNDVKVKLIRTDNGTEFRNHELKSFCDEKGISQNFSSPYTPEQNGVAERKNRTLIEAARTMLNGSLMSKHFWTEVVKIACYTQNRSITIKRHDKTPYEIFRERIPDISYFHVFGLHVFIHKHKDHLGKFDGKSDDGYFLGYSSVLKAFRVYNTRRQQIDETYHVTFDESMGAIRFTNTSVDEIGIDDSSRYPLDEFLHEDDPSRQYQDIKDTLDLINTEETHEQNVQDDQRINQPTNVPSGNNTKASRPITDPLVPDVSQSHIPYQASISSHPAPQDRWSRDQHTKLVNIIEPKKVSEALKHPGWIDAMSKKYEHGTTTKNKTRLVAQGHSQDDEGILIYQEQYTRNLLKKYKIFDSSLVKTPMVPPNNLGLNLAGKSVNETSYTRMIRSLMYLTATRLDIQFSIVLCARYQSNPKESHLIVVKRILKYLKGTPTLGLYYLKCSGFDLKGYSNSDYAGCNMDRKSTLVVYQNFLKEFWSTAVSFDPFPSIDEPEKRPSRNFSSSFLSQTGALSKKRIKPKSKIPPTETKESPPNPTKGSEQSHLISSCTVPNSQDLERNVQLASTGFPSILHEGSCNSQPLPESTVKPPKDSGGNNQPLDRDLTFMTYNEGMTKTPLRPKGDQNDKLVEAFMSSLDRSSTTISDLYKGLNDTFEIKSMMTEMYATFQGCSFLAPSGSVTLTLALTDIQANVEDNATTTATKEPPSHTKGETKKLRLAITISSIPSTVIPPTQPITSIIIHPKSSQATLMIDKGKVIATESDDDPSKKLVKASSIAYPDPDEPVRVKFIENSLSN
uniref:Retrovirus-related Pol polyprotein from transposon TNT 1-94 n=1 Tax=Tanacetum cinerariifolium TaxID=118510 RepID=A0A6L2P705_TANCI|nr:retrovirus-related Pol polyprotein from transposon TNT 1-94 [Tanacetum cinerariifolium]